MKKITDETLNDYIDNQLDGASIQELKMDLDNNEEALKKLKALKVVDNSLKNIEVILAPEGFTNRIMSIIAKGSRKAVSKVSYFFVSVIGLFTALILAVMGFAYYTTASSTPSTEKGYSLNKISEYLAQFVSILQNVFKNQNITTIGMILTILLLISGYYLLESHKDFKNKLKNLS
ncbi:MAG: hypothetical protein KGZ42_01160 [Melioribacter sp.]|nr:hypothetical protein [Melioribacter sp.]